MSGILHSKLRNETHRCGYTVFLTLTVLLIYCSPAFAQGIEFDIGSGEGSLQKTSDLIWTLKQTSPELAVDVSSFSLGANDTLSIEPVSADSTTYLKFSGSETFEIPGSISTPANLKLSAKKIKLKGKLIASGNQIELTADSVVLDGGEVDASHKNKPGGTVIINGSQWVSLGGKVDVSGSTGGHIEVSAGGLNIAGSVFAMGNTGPGGSIDLKTKRKSWENTSAYLDVSGATGGRVRHITDQQITTSGKYLALGEDGIGGSIDITAPALKFLSTQINASGQTGGGQIRLGGELKGGKDLDLDELPNAQLLSMTDGTNIIADSLGPDGPGGTIIVWSEKKSTVLGTLSARPGAHSGKGGFVETSSADRLIFAGKTLAGMNDRAGEFLMDPKNIEIKEINEVNQQAIIIGSGYDALNAGSQSLEEDDNFGDSVSLDGNRLAVGTNEDNGFNNSKSSSGSVYLYTFKGESFTGGTLEATIGSGYTGGKNINQVLDIEDFFGSSVSLDGNRLAVGAEGDDGFGNSGGGNGAVYLYSFSDGAFSGGNLEATIGFGYSGGKNIDQTLDSFDVFGSSVSLNSNRLAVGARLDDGTGNSTSSAGAVYLYSFSDGAFSGGNLEATIGFGYSGGKNIDQTLDGSDFFGGSVSLDGNRLAVGAYGDDEFGNSGGENGAVYLYSFTDGVFSEGNLEATIGDGYSGGKNIDQTLGASNFFGYSLSLDGNRLAVGAVGDNDGTGFTFFQGAVYLYSFTDSIFSGGTLEATIGTNIDDIVLDLDNGDWFGSSISLDGNRLAVGAFGDDGKGDSKDGSGAVYLYTFTDDTFTGGTLEATIGSGYSGGKNLSLALGANDNSGRSVSLNGNQLAIGASNDGGQGDAVSGAGAVYLYTFTDNSYFGGALEAIIGSGYTGGKNVNQSLDSSDAFGRAISLDANRLAVGAYRDDGDGNFITNMGAVYLYTFSDSSFSGGNLEAIIGNGYSGPKDINQTLELSDFFGIGVSLDGDRLAVGADFDNGAGNVIGNSGTVYLYTFSDSSFSGGNLEAQIGVGYSGGKNINNQSLEGSDRFGHSVSLNGNRLAVSADSDDGSQNNEPGSGAVYLYSFTDSVFSGGNLEAIIGDGYSGGKNIEQDLDSDSFGESVSLDGNQLAVGSQFDDGQGLSGSNNKGAVYLYNFTDSTFSGGNLETIIGDDYTDGKNINQPLGSSDEFGSSVSLDNNRLAVGAIFDDGESDSLVGSGIVYLYRFSDDSFSPLIDSSNSISNATFSTFPGQDSCVSSSLLAETLSSGNNVTLQANNDITVSSPLTVDNPSGTDGSLTMQSGRSILIKSNITFEDGDLTLIANETPANGVDSLFRDVGEAQVTMDAATAIDLGTGDLNIEMREGDNHEFTDCGSVTLQTINAANILVDSACNTSNINFNGPITGTSISLSADQDIITTSQADMTATGAVSIIADADSNSDAGSGGILDLVFGTVIDAGFSSITLSSDESLGMGSLVTQSSSATAVSIESKSGGIGATGEEEIDISAPNGGLVISSTGDFGSDINIVIGEVSDLDFNGIGGQAFFMNKDVTAGFDQSTSSVLENSGTVNIPVSLNKVNGTTTVEYSVTGGTAIGGGTDYTLANGTLTFTPGETTQNISVALVNNANDEPDKTIIITISNPDNAGLGTNQSHTLTILDDDFEGLLVSPLEDLTSSGNEGGPFTPNSKTYTLTNTGGTSIDYTVSKTQDWVTVTDNGMGTLGSGADTMVEVTINPTANSLTNGNYSDTITFTNTTDGEGNTTRSVDLNVLAVIEASDLNFVDSGQLLGSGDSNDVALEDLDGDEDIDAFVANASPNTVWFNDGSGTFSNSGQSLGSSTSHSVVLGDLDGDGDKDAFIANNNGEANKVWLNAGAGNFSDSLQSLGSFDSFDVALMDLDGDMDLDAFVANGNGQANKVWLNNGSGSFADSGQSLGTGDSRSVALADLNGDTFIDAFIGNSNGIANTVWFNDGLGNFSNSEQSLGSSDSYGVALGTLENDSDVDAFIANGNSQANKVWGNTGTGSFFDTFQNLGNVVSQGVSLGDLDGDGDLDAFVANGTGSASTIWVNDGEGDFTLAGNTAGSSNTRAVSLADIDGDQDLDAFLANEGANRVFENNDTSPIDIEAIPDQSTIQGEPYTGPVPVYPGTEPIVWSLITGPEGMTINTGTGVVAWDPAVLGSHSIIIQASSVEGTDTESWTINVEASANPPNIFSIENQTIVTNQEYLGPIPEVTGTVPFVWSLVNNPAGMTIDADTGQVTWPVSTTVGSPHTVTIQALNNEGFDRESWELIVVENAIAPDIDSIDDEVILNTQSYRKTPVFAGTHPMTWILATGPDGMTINEATGVIAWNNPKVAGSPHLVSILVLNEVGFDDESWTLTVNPSLDDLDNFTIVEDEPYIDVVAIADGESCELQDFPQGLSILPQTVNINENLFCVVIWSAPKSEGSPHLVSFQVSDEQNTALEDLSFVLTVVKALPIISSISNQFAKPGETYVGPIPIVTGIKPITWSLVSGPGGMTINAATGEVTWANPTTVGSPHKVVIQAENDAGTNTESWEVVVTGTGIGPVIIPPSLLVEDSNTVPDNADLNLVITIRIREGETYKGPNFSVTGVEPISWSLLEAPSGMTIDSNNGSIVWEKPTSAGSPHTVTVQAANAEGADSLSWILEVEPLLDSPVFSEVDSLKVEIGEKFSLDVPVQDGDSPFTCKLTDAPEGMTSEFFRAGLGFSEHCKVTWESPTSDASPYLINLRITDDKNRFSDVAWVLTVEAAETPQIASIADISLQSNDIYVQGAKIEGGTLPVEWILQQGPAGMVVDNAKGIVTWSNPIPGQHIVKLKAENDAGEVTESWTLNVQDSNAEHAIKFVRDAKGKPNPVESGKQVAMEVEAFDTFGHDLSFNWSSTCSGLANNGSFNNNTLRTPVWAAPENATGLPSICTISVVIDDGNGVTSTPTFVQGVIVAGTTINSNLGHVPFQPVCYGRFCNQAQTKFSITNNNEVAKIYKLKSSRNWLDIDDNPVLSDFVPELNIPIRHDMAIPQVTETSVTLDPGQTATFTATVNTNGASIETGNDEAQILLEDEEGNPLGSFDILLILVEDPFDVDKSQRVISPYWQADTQTYTFIAVSHPGLQDINADVGVVINAVQSDLAPYGPTLEFTVSANSTKRVFIVSTNNPFINDTFIPDAGFIVGTTSGKHGQLVIGPKASHPKTDTGSGYPDITMLNFWGAIVVQATSTGFAMEFIGDMHDSSAMNQPLVSGIN